MQKRLFVGDISKTNKGAISVQAAWPNTLQNKDLGGMVVCLLPLRQGDSQPNKCTWRLFCVIFLFFLKYFFYWKRGTQAHKCTFTLPERPIETRRKFGTVTQDGNFVAESFFNQQAFYCPHPAVHHIWRCNHLAACKDKCAYQRHVDYLITTREWQVGVILLDSNRTVSASWVGMINPALW